MGIWGVGVVSIIKNNLMSKKQLLIAKMFIGIVLGTIIVGATSS